MLAIFNKGVIALKEDRNIYMFKSAGWKHLETNEVVKRGGIPLDTADIQALKALYDEQFISELDAEVKET